MALRRAIGAVKDRTTIGLAKVGSSNSLADLDVAIVRATSHDQYPPEEKYYHEIFSLTCYSPTLVGCCVNTISRRLSKTKNWVVALKTLMLVQKLLAEGDPGYQQEIFFSTRRGTRMLNMTDFRDSRSNSWDYSAFVRMYALYLDERLEYKIQGRKRHHHHYRTRSCASSQEEYPQSSDQHRDNNNNTYTASASASASGSCSGSGSSPWNWTVATCDLTMDQILSKMHHLQQLLERFIATRPAGSAKQDRIVIVALYSAVRDSFQIYYDITDILAILIDQFMELEIPECIKVHEILCRISNQFDELDSYYSWCKDIGVVRSSEYPEVEKITRKKLDLMDEYIREKAANTLTKLAIMDRKQGPASASASASQEEIDQEVVEDMNTIKALPPPEGFPQHQEEEEEEEEEKELEPKQSNEPEAKEADLMHLGDDAPTSEEHGDKLALALFDGDTPNIDTTSLPLWEAFNDTSDWETKIVKSPSHFPHQKASFDTMLLNGMYQHNAANRVGGTGSASSVALGSLGNPKKLPLPSFSANYSTVVDPFAASLGVAPPPYVQMSDFEKKQRRLVEEQFMWQQYQRDGMQGPVALSKIQQTPANIGGYGFYHYRY
ncbi:hypothetical protein SOVF_123690 [Spinacia oleracea]|uniref:Clathrin assembly protein At1g03050 n=1 Tax=Spinacia oleracea TaxID=3562 RepID=A0ABM3QKD6_SPIOL|nr:putative clathrin assembly protein At1g03050 [Spinacia oleracea]KNA12665.1 hypothetical protein SOVF_123690 [Spinacia oleracea]